MDRRGGVESGGESCEEPIELEGDQQLSGPGSLHSEDINRWLDEMDMPDFDGAEGGDGSEVPDCFFDGPDGDPGKVDDQQEPASKRKTNGGAIDQRGPAGRNDAPMRLLADQGASVQRLERVRDDLRVGVALLVAEHVHRQGVSLDEEAILWISTRHRGIGAAWNRVGVRLHHDACEQPVRRPTTAVVANID